MAVALDGTPDGDSLGSGNPTSTINVTVNSGSDRVLILFMATSNQTNGVVSSVSGAGGTWSPVGSGHGAVFEGSCWKNIAPSVGAAQTVTITWTGNTDGNVGMAIFSLNGVNQTTPADSFQIRSTAGDLVVATTTGDLCLSAQFDNNSNRTVSGCTTTLDDTGFGNTGFSLAHCTGASSATFTWSGYFSTSVGMAINVKQVSGGAGGGPLVNGGSITHGSLIRGGRILG